MIYQEGAQEFRCLVNRKTKRGAQGPHLTIFWVLGCRVNQVQCRGAVLFVWCGFGVFGPICNSSPSSFDQGVRFFLFGGLLGGVRIWGMGRYTRTSANEEGLELQFGGDMPKLKSGSFLGFWGY